MMNNTQSTNVTTPRPARKGKGGGSVSRLFKDTAIYGLSSIIGRFLNYLLVPLYTHYMPTESGDYGISTNVYAYTALILVLLTFGMETTLFRFANDAPNDQTAKQPNNQSWPDTVFSTGFALIATLTALFLIGIFGFITPIADTLGYAEHPDYLLMMAVVVACRRCPSPTCGSRSAPSALPP